VSDEIPSAFSEFSVGSRIAGYRLEEQIGRGGMAVVYRAYDARLDRRVALKILAPGLALDEGFRHRFIRESRAAAAVDHPNIIPVFDAGEASGVLFIAMRFVQGRDVGTLIDRTGPLPPARASDIIAQVASALDAAHARGLVHRDVKPANMLLDESTGEDRQDHVYLSDFGLSKQSLSQTGITSQGQVLGTLDYIAPEQIEGRAVDGRADLYSLACAAFELLSGAPPFKRGGGLAVVWAQLSEPPPPLTARRAGLPSAIDDVLARAMAKSPADRYRRCGEFAAALREVLGLRPGDRGRSGEREPPGPATQLAVLRPDLPSGPAGDAPWVGEAAPAPSARDAASAGAAPPPRDGASAPAAGAWPAGGEPRRAEATIGPEALSAGEAVSGRDARSAGDAVAAQDAGPDRDVASAGGALAREDAISADDATPPWGTPLPWGTPSGAVAGSAPPAGHALPAGDALSPGDTLLSGHALAAGDALPAGTGAPAGYSGRSYEAEPYAGRSYDAGPPTEAAGSVPAIQATRPGLTEPGGPPSGPRGYELGGPRRRSRGALLAAAVVVVLGIAAGAFVIARGGGGGKPATGLSANLTIPAPTRATATAPLLSQVRTNEVGLGSLVHPFGVAVTPHGRYSFVSLGNFVSVLDNHGGSLAPTQVATIPAPGAGRSEAITSDGRYLLAAKDSGAYVINAKEAEAGNAGGAVMGTLAGPPGNPSNEVSVSPDDKFVFITFQNDGDVAVFNLREAIAGGFGHSGYRGLIRLGPKSEPQAMAHSPDGRWLYVTGESQAGRLYVVDMRKAETDPPHAVYTSAAAGAAPARVIVSADGGVVWVTDRDSNALVAFSAARLLTNPSQSLIARVSVGQNPIGLAFVKDGREIVVADADSIKRPGEGNLAVISTQRALRTPSRGALLGYIPAGTPRELALEPDGHTLLATDNNSGQLQAIDARSLP
jgi:DNA-binding beta-propeller fold protein YncE